MNLEEQLLTENSRANADYIADYIGESSKRFDRLMIIFLSDRYRLTQRAAQVVSTCSERYPTLLKPHLSSLVMELRKPGVNDAVKRNILRTFQFIELPEKLHGLIIDSCFQFLTDRKEAVAIQVFSMTVLFHHVKNIPELRNELGIVIEDMIPLGSAGIKARGRHILKEINKLKKD